MALIGKIRKNFWLVVILLALGLGGFIFMDMFSQRGPMGGGNSTLGVINGEKLDWQTFNTTERVMLSGASNILDARNTLWEYFVEETLVKEEAEALGLGVSKEELVDMMFGPDDRISPIIRQNPLFSNPQTRQLNREAINQFKDIIQNDRIGDLVAQGQIRDEFEFKYYWAHQEREVINDRLVQKMNFLVSKAMYTPTWLTKAIHNEQNQKVNLEFVQIPFDEIEDNAVQVTDADLSAYLDAHKEDYRVEKEERIVEFVSFEVLPTKKDTLDILDGFSGLAQEFRETEDDSSFVSLNEGAMDEYFVQESAIPAQMLDTVKTMAVGDVVGPYIDQGAYRIIKLRDKTTVADSVKSRHILIGADPADPATVVQAQAVADSLLQLLQDGVASFDSLAVKHSVDQSNSGKGGDLGYAKIGQMVPPFNEFIFFAGTPGEPGTVTTRFGVHIVEVIDRKFGDEPADVYKMAALRRSIIPSQNTQDSIRDVAAQILSSCRDLDALKTAVEAHPGVNVETSNPLGENDYTILGLGSGLTSRDVVKFAWNPESRIGDVSPEIFTFSHPVEIYDEKFVLAGLKDIRKAGVPSLDQLRDQITPIVLNEKKGEMIKNAIASTDLQTIARDYDTEVDTAQGVAFSSGFIQGIGNEPKIVALAFSTDINTVSTPVVGTNGIYIVRPISKTPETDAPSAAILRRTSATSTVSQVRSRLIAGLREDAKIKDNRAVFY